VGFAWWHFRQRSFPRFENREAFGSQTRKSTSRAKRRAEMGHRRRHFVSRRATLLKTSAVKMRWKQQPASALIGSGIFGFGDDTSDGNLNFGGRTWYIPAGALAGIP